MLVFKIELYTYWFSIAFSMHVRRKVEEYCCEIVVVNKKEFFVTLVAFFFKLEYLFT